MNLIKNFIREEDGVTAIEYGLIAALIAVVIIAAITIVGTQLKKPSAPSAPNSPPPMADAVRSGPAQRQPGLRFPIFPARPP